MLVSVELTTVPTPTREPVAGLHGVALFDLDRTLVPGSSLVSLGRELVRRGMLERRVLARRAASAAAFRRRGLSDGRVEDLVGGLLALLAGREVEPLAEVAGHVGAEVAAEAYPGALWLLQRHLDAGDFCVVLTAAPQPLAEAVAHAIGAHRAIGTRLAVVGGRFTGALDGPFCHGPGKVLRLREELGDMGSTRSSAYGDSASDVAVLERCTDPVAVNPDRRLTAVAAARSWPVLRLA